MYTCHWGKRTAVTSCSICRSAFRVFGVVYRERFADRGNICVVTQVTMCQTGPIRGDTCSMSMLDAVGQREGVPG